MLIFGVRSETDRHDVERALGVHFEPHESIHFGGDYWLAHLPESGAEVRIRPNVDLLWSPGDPENERFAYPEHAEHELLLEVDHDDPQIVDRLLRVPVVQLLSSPAGNNNAG